jgi:hypothetical protein
VALGSILLLALLAFNIVDVVDPHQLECWLLLVQSRALVAINHHCHSLQYSKNNIIDVIASCNTSLKNDHRLSTMSSSL